MNQKEWSVTELTEPGTPFSWLDTTNTIYSNSNRYELTRSACMRLPDVQTQLIQQGVPLANHSAVTYMINHLAQGYAPSDVMRHATHSWDENYDLNSLVSITHGEGLLIRICYTTLLTHLHSTDALLSYQHAQ
mgnify:CR=1 FL=1